MNFNKQEYIFIISKIARTKDATTELVGKINDKIEMLKQHPLETTVTIVSYNSEPAFVVKRKNVNELPVYTNSVFTSKFKKSSYYDAVCETMGLIGEELSLLPEEDRPCSVVVFTEDGAYDNASVENTINDFNWQIGVQRGKYNWKFEKL